MGKSLFHYGIKGQEWGRRRYQYEDGSYTPEGLERYGRSPKDMTDEELDAAIKRQDKENQLTLLRRDAAFGGRSMNDEKAYTEAYRTANEAYRSSRDLDYYEHDRNIKNRNDTIQSLNNVVTFGTAAVTLALLLKTGKKP